MILFIHICIYVSEMLGVDGTVPRCTVFNFGKNHDLGSSTCLV
jgi:hypothetical protein